MSELPLLRRFPSLRLPRARLGSFPTPVHSVPVAGGRELLLKRDDLTARPVGGNKVRGLEWLLGDVSAGDRVLTVGARGSTHALATATYAGQLGASTTVVRWQQETNPAADVVAQRTRQVARVIDVGSVVAAYAIALALRTRCDWWIPAGGSNALSVLGHVNAGLEFAEQVARGECERPDCIVLPVGTGGTAAGIALGLRIASLDVPVVAVRVVPRIVGTRRRVRRLAAGAARLLETAAGERIPRLRREDVVFEDRFFGGAYGRPLPATLRSAISPDALGVVLDDTYSAKALAAALARDVARPLLWLTFDGRILSSTSAP